MDSLPEKIVVLGAFRIEVERVGEGLDRAGAVQKKGSLTFVTGEYGSRKVLVGSTGMGKVRAAAGAQAALDLFEPGLFLHCGTAGALSEQLRPLDLVVADRLLQHDTGPEDPEWIEGEPWLLDLLAAASRAALQGEAHQLCRGDLVTGDRPVLEVKERDALRRRFSALAVDMEGAALADVARANQVPFAAVKAITDSADAKGISDFKKHVQKGAALAQHAVIILLDR